MKKSSVSLLLSVCLPISAFAQISDINGHWAESQIRQLEQKGVVSGYNGNLFNPDGNITRAEFITLINKASGFTEKEDISFNDVKNSDWFADQIKIAAKQKYIGGYEDNTFRPQNNITKEEATTAIAKVLNLSGDENTANSFADSAEFTWSKKYIGATKKANIISGYEDNTFKPKNFITRAEAVVLILKAEDYKLNLSYTEFNESKIYGTDEMQTINNDVFITTAGITLKNYIINGNLTIAGDINIEDINFENITVTGTIYINGGNSTKIYFKNSNSNNLVITKSGLYIEILDSSISNLIVSNTANDTTLNISEKSNVDKADIRAISEILGKGKIKEAKAVSNVKFETRPSNLEMDISYESSKSEGGGGSSSGGGGGSGNSSNSNNNPSQPTSSDNSQNLPTETLPPETETQPPETETQPTEPSTDNKITVCDIVIDGININRKLEGEINPNNAEQIIYWLNSLEAKVFFPDIKITTPTVDDTVYGTVYVNDGDEVTIDYNNIIHTFIVGNDTTKDGQKLKYPFSKDNLGNPKIALDDLGLFGITSNIPDKADENGNAIITINTGKNPPPFNNRISEIEFPKDNTSNQIKLYFSDIIQSNINELDFIIYDTLTGEISKLENAALENNKTIVLNLQNNYNLKSNSKYIIEIRDKSGNTLTSQDKIYSNIIKIPTNSTAIITAKDYGYSNWFSTATRYIYEQNGELRILQFKSGTLTIEEFDTNYSSKGQKHVQIELPKLGGFHKDEQGYYYIVSGQGNPNEDKDLPVFNICKYDSNWNKIKSVDIKNVYTKVPFDACNLTINSNNGILAVYTGRLRYKSSDGVEHQSNIHFVVDTANMELIYKGGQWPFNHISHCFASYVKVDGDNIIYLSHGDAYPRTICLQVTKNNKTLKTHNLVKFDGKTGNNYTGAYLGGFEISNNNYLVIGSNAGGMDNKLPKKVFLSVLPKNAPNNSTGNYRLLTDGSYSVKETHIVKVNDNKFVLMWRAENKNSLFYQIIDGEGNTLVNTIELENTPSPYRLDPIVYDNSIIWYYAPKAGEKISLYKLDLE